MVHRSLLPVAAALVLLSVGCSAQECVSTKDAVSNFSATMYMGKWYEYAKKGDTPREDGSICVTEEYSMSNGNITVVNSMRDNTTLALNSTTGWAEYATAQSSEGKLKVHFQNSPVVGDYWVLGTDYNSYSIVWSCEKRQDDDKPTGSTWVLVRSTNVSNMTLKEVDGQLSSLGLPQLSQFTKTEQSSKYCAGAGHVMGAVFSVVMASLFALLR